MNAYEKEEIGEHIASLEQINDNLEILKHDETELYNNMPLGQKESERGEKVQKNIEALDNAYIRIAEAMGYLEEI